MSRSGVYWWILVEATDLAYKASARVPFLFRLFWFCTLPMPEAARAENRICSFLYLYTQHHPLCDTDYIVAKS